MLPLHSSVRYMASMSCSSQQVASQSGTIGLCHGATNDSTVNHALGEGAVHSDAQSGGWLGGVASIVVVKPNPHAAIATIIW